MRLKYLWERGNKQVNKYVKNTINTDNVKDECNEGTERINDRAPG